MPPELVPKPIVPILSPPVFLHPARNYMASVLYQDIKAANPRTALDAGAGRLRNYWMFPAGSYHALGLLPEEMENALPTMAELRKRLGEPTRYVIDLNEAFDSIGPFDLVVCTATADYLERPMDTLGRLALLLHPGGTLLFQVSTRHVDAFLACGLSDLFGAVSYFTYDCLNGPRSPSSITKSLFGSADSLAQDISGDDTGDLTPDMKTKLVKLGQLEMTTPCERADAQNIYVRCRGRIENRAALLKTGT